MTADDDTIKVFCRLRPIVNGVRSVEYQVERDADGDELCFEVPSDHAARQSNNFETSFSFGFARIFDGISAQRDVYNEVARPIVESAMLGYNGTVFAYGQTSTGKTYTIVGDDLERLEAPPAKANPKKKRRGRPAAAKNPPPEQNGYAESPRANGLEEEPEMDEGRIEVPPLPNADGDDDAISAQSMARGVPATAGLVARTLAHIFSMYNEHTRVEISYLEIYKEVGYDLLNGKRGERRRIHDLSELPRVSALMTAKRNLFLRNLSSHQVRSEREAMELLAHGNANRKVAETHLNNASSRSHCIFTIKIHIQIPDLRTVLRAKVNLVDLAGSERVGKSHLSSDRLLTEAKNINLSLHHLQQCIVALSGKNAALRGNRHHHVPFRNSMMTMVLKDSLGGNAMTAMVATVSADRRHLEETVSTCRFAQRVASIKNRAKVNQTVDSEVVIERLQRELRELKQNELNHQAGRALMPMSPLNPDEQELLEELIRNYVEDDDDGLLELGDDHVKIQYCFRKMKDIIRQQQGLAPARSPRADDPGSDFDESSPREDDDGQNEGADEGTTPAPADADGKRKNKKSRACVIQ